MNPVQTMFVVLSVAALTVTPHSWVLAEHDVVGTLNHLIQTAKDGQNGFNRAAQDTQNLQLRNLFISLSEQRAEYVDELQGKVAELGGEPKVRGSARAALRRGWIRLKSAVTDYDERSIIAEAEKSESVANAVYQDALKEGLPREVETVVQKQAESVESSYELMQTLESLTDKGADLNQALAKTDIGKGKLKDPEDIKGFKELKKEAMADEAEASARKDIGMLQGEIQNR
ncbi:MAG: PA2169 family four-helix-bundle protein [Candidatus Omnitrophica bacterium]|nr:PA2169 family four-helix-bundle protein [Candidatus Omnitrophota bacterium]